MSTGSLLPAQVRRQTSGRSGFVDLLIGHDAQQPSQQLKFATNKVKPQTVITASPAPARYALGTVGLVIDTRGQGRCGRHAAAASRISAGAAIGCLHSADLCS